MLETTHAKREIAIQLSAPMVRATLNGSKSVTRRTVKGEIPNGAVRAVFNPYSEAKRPAWRWIDAADRVVGKPFRCPYGIAGETMLWGREAWRTLPRLDGLPPRDVPAGSPVTFYADGGDEDASLGGKFRPGMFMPRWASRILLEVIDVKVERLQDITRGQAIAEGIERVGDRWRHYFFPTEDGEAWEFPQNSFASLWDKLNGEGAWESDPYVFAISFRRLAP